MTYSSKPTTLSLLSRILELELGESRLQHYGLFEETNATSQDAITELVDGQQRFEEALAELVEKKDANAVVLIVGDTALSLAKLLAEAGKSVHWFGSKSLLNTQINDLASFHYAGDDFVASNKPSAVDVLIYAGSICYLDQMALLSKSRDLLGDSGQLILFGEFLHDDSRIEYSALPNLSSFKQLFKRLGFSEIEDRDLSISASHTLKLVRPLLEAQGAALAREAAVEANLLEDLQAEFSLMQDEFSIGRRGFHLYVLHRESNSRYEWADVEFGDIQSFLPVEVADLFQKSFNVDFDEELWNWKYAQGDGKCVVARLSKQSEIVAHYGGAPRKIVYFGGASMAIQPCDVMVHPSIRKQYGKGSLFFELAATFLEREIGNTVNHLLGFGFPNQKTMNISKRLGLYEKTDDFLEIVYPVLPASEGQEKNQATIVDYDPLDVASREELDSLWAAMKDDYRDGIIGVRDAEYIQHRYVNHPFSKTKQYRCVIIRADNSGQALAFAVMKEHDGGKLLMDLICPVAMMKPAISILKQELGSGEVGAVLRLWVTSSGKDKVLTEGAIVNELGIEIPCNSWNPGPSAEVLYGAWWLTAGDMDFI
ncbi:MAG: GNAT family N-acetyltransferase [Gammaproteobacteria bacterium]|nr:GNAT family N-acetyltransferase [Gammaproteobacteria bacterium]